MIDNLSSTPGAQGFSGSQPFDGKFPFFENINRYDRRQAGLCVAFTFIPKIEIKL
jgi:hypothetical protein